MLTHSFIQSLSEFLPLVVQSLSPVQLFASPWTAASQESLSFTISQILLKLMSIELVMPSNHLILCHPLLLLPSIFPCIKVFPISQSFTSGGQSIRVSALASFLLKKSQGLSPSEWTGGSPCSPRDSQESSPTPQLKSINSSVLSFIYGPTLTSIHDYRKNHSLD